MKMVKSLLLGSAAGLVAVTAGQAAELPVKAKPVQYVKICSLYGAGFYYMPGTDMCLKIGGWVRAEATDETNGNLAVSGSPTAGNGIFSNDQNTRLTNNLGIRARGYITADAREQTAYGVARAYIDVGISGTDVGGGGVSTAPGLAATSNRAFLQWAGFTAGLSASFYDFFSSPATNYRGFIPNEDTGDGGWFVWAYTAQFGGGFSATLSAEDRRNTQILGQAAAGGLAASTLISDTLGTGYAGWQVPDIVGNLRVDQAWGSAQVMGAFHQVNAGYYGVITGINDETAGHPGDANGWVVGAGLKINAPFVSPGDYFQGEVNYTEGALRYLDHGFGQTFDDAQGNSQGYGIQADCVYGGTLAAANATGCQLTTGWGVIGAYEHYWTPQWHQSFTGGYMAVNYGSSANAMLCSMEGQGGAGFGSASTAVAGCNNNWAYWGAGSRLQWDVTKSFYVGVEVIYSQLISATSATGLVPIQAGLGDATTCDTGTCTASNESNWGITLRMHKDFLP